MQLNSAVIVLDNAENQEKILAESYAAQFQPAYYVENSRNISWEKALEWAQESLINKDIFARVCSYCFERPYSVFS